MKIVHFIPIRSQTWPPQEILERTTDDGRQVMANVHIAFGKVS
jgi:hypothetical protein